MLSKTNTLSWHHNARFMASSPRFPRRWSLPALQLQLGWSLFLFREIICGYAKKTGSLWMVSRWTKNRDFVWFFENHQQSDAIPSKLMSYSELFLSATWFFVDNLTFCEDKKWRYCPQKNCGESISKNGDVLPTNMRSLFNRIYTSIITHIYIYDIYIYMIYIDIYIYIQ